MAHTRRKEPSWPKPKTLKPQNPKAGKYRKNYLDELDESTGEDPEDFFHAGDGAETTSATEDGDGDEHTDDEDGAGSQD